ncbi:YDG/SRA domain-containing protein, partial [Rhodothermus sp. AH-315-K08]|nr:YDG/SRA domain-containing protein [Rhodothermus sp. AH-315-K08]
MGADAIALNQGYKNDDDSWHTIVYTGERGQKNGVQVTDQAMSPGNAGLIKSRALGLPVRVIRGHKLKQPWAPPKGKHRYDGLYLVTDYSYGPSSDGPLVYRFVLTRCDDALPDVSPDNVPGRVKTEIQRIVRDTKTAKAVKVLHDYRCQVC